MAQPRNTASPTRARETAAARWQRDRSQELIARREQDRRIVPVNATILGMNPQGERALLGCCLLAFEPFEATTDALTPDDFDEWRHKLIFQAISDSSRAPDGTVDVVMLNEQLKRMGELGEVGQDYIAELVGSVPSWTNYREYLRIVLECSLTRESQHVGAALTQGDLTPQETMLRLQAIETRRLRVLGGAAALIGVLASEVTPEPIRWLWKRRLARGKLAILDGDPELGKGLITMDLAARKSTGRPFPGDKEPQAPSHVIVISPEDDIADTLVPRLIAAQADLYRVTILNTITITDPETGKMTERSVTIPRDVPVIEQKIAETGAELVIIDPVHGCLDSGVNINRDNEVRDALMPLKHLATRTDVAVLLVRHLNKSNNDKAMYRGGGSIAFTALCRTAFAVAEHPDNPDKRVFLPVKSNISAHAPGLVYSITSRDPDSTPWIWWEDEPTDLHANDVLSGGAKRSAEQREVIEVMKSGGVTLPATPIDIALCLGIARDDESGQARMRQRLSRMARSGVLVSRVRGLYDLPSTILSQQSH